VPGERSARALADPIDPAIASAEIASELRRGADYVRVTVALPILTTDVADALTIAWEAFRSATQDDPTGWEAAAATAQVQLELRGLVWLDDGGRRQPVRLLRLPSEPAGMHPPGGGAF
jgi:hypothetical protein